MRLSKRGAAFLRAHEGFVPNYYKDPVEWAPSASASHGRTLPSATGGRRTVPARSSAPVRS